MTRGRIRAKLFNADGSPIHPNIKSRKDFYLAIAAEVKENIKKVRAWPHFLVLQGGGEGGGGAGGRKGPEDVFA